MKETVKTFKALSDETRLRILHLLIEAGEICVCDMETVLGCPQAKVSRHLTILKNAGLVDDRREGLWVLYSLVKPADSTHAAVLKMLRETGGGELFSLDKKKLLQAIQQGRCKTFGVIKPEKIPQSMAR
ncbi:MAG: metalloregulator ArsR/SmtB family transcription factor [Acidobacteriia bacterium]|nr:metalloregulator ArsR/SmtB family transcription factor [Terriglobia bacterium]